MLYIQLIGLLAFCILVLSFYRKTPKEILMFQMTANFAYAVHFFLLGALSGAYISIISIIRNISFLVFKKNKLLLAFIIIALYITVTIIFYENAYSILPLAANSFYIIAILKDNKLSLLKGQIVCSLLWLLYGIFITSYAEMISETILCITALIQIKKLKKSNMS